MKIKLFCFIAIIIFSVNSFSGELIKSASVIEIASHATGNGKNFALRTESGTGLCTGWIYFFEDQAPSPATYNQNFTLALTAMAASMKVRIHDYDGDNCTSADFLAITK